MARIGLSLSGGGAKGAFSAGVLYRLQIKGFFRKNPITVVSGTSTGSLIGTLIARRQFAELKQIYAGGVKTGNILAPAAGEGALKLIFGASSIFGKERPADNEELLVNNLEMLGIAAVVDKRNSIYSIQPLKDLIRSFIGLQGLDEIINDDSVELIYNVVSMNSGDAKRFSSKDTGRTPTEMERALWASVSQPVFMPLVDIGQEWYADGGLAEVNPVQAVFASSMPYDCILAISCSPDPSKVGYSNELGGLEGILIRTIDVLLDDVTLNDLRVPYLTLALRSALDELKIADAARYDRVIAGFNDQLRGDLASINFDHLKSVPIVYVAPSVQVLENGLAFDPAAMKGAFASGEKAGDDLLSKLIEAIA